MINLILFSHIKQIIRQLRPALPLDVCIFSWDTLCINIFPRGALCAMQLEHQPPHDDGVLHIGKIHGNRAPTHLGFTMVLWNMVADMIPPHSGLRCDTSSKWVCLYPMPHYGRGCRISTLIMVPINFWRNSDLFKKKEHFSSSKIDKVRAFQRKSLKIFKENLSNTKHKSLKRFWCYYDDCECQIE